MDWSDRIGRRIKLRDLHILMAVADTGSMAKAAARLRIFTSRHLRGDIRN
jgi:hypothetical protein